MKIFNSNKKNEKKETAESINARPIFINGKRMRLASLVHTQKKHQAHKIKETTAYAVDDGDAIVCH